MTLNEALNIVEHEKQTKELLNQIFRSFSHFTQLDQICFLLAEELQKQQPPQQWISVRDRLPEEQQDCLCCYHFKGYEKQYISCLTYFAFDCKPHWQHNGTDLVVTHWMPLPEPPEIDEEEENERD